MKTKKTNAITERDWNELVQSTYCKPYNLQQQGGCMDNGSFVEFSVPNTAEDDGKDEAILEKEYHDQKDSYRGATFEQWLSRDSKKPLNGQEYDWQLDFFWSRNFYPNLEVLAQDLYKKGLLEEGHYSIHVSW